MIVGRNRKWIVAALALLTLSLPISAGAQGFPGGFREAFGSRFEAVPQLQQAPPRQPRAGGPGDAGRIRYWNEIMLAANALDHTPVAAGENRVFGEQLGPGRTSRAFAIVHIAIFDAVNAIVGGYRGYSGLAPAPPAPLWTLPSPRRRAIHSSRSTRRRPARSTRDSPKI